MACLVASVVAVTAEFTARFDDWVRFGTALWTNPNNGVDLRIADSRGVRGRPHGRYQQFVLNNFGFRSERDHTLKVRDGCTRVMTLGASETFGLLEPSGDEYPAQLERLLRSGGSCFEVLNAAVAGMSLPAIRYTWSHFWRQFTPDFVVVYPSPAFYLGDTPPQPPSPRGLRPGTDAWPPLSLKPRLIHRAKEAIEFPSIIQRQRVRRKLENELNRIGKDSIWTTVPSTRLVQFGVDLEALVSEIKVTGATPVLMTHARRFPLRPDESDEDLLQAWRSFSPRAEPAVLIAFDTAAARVTRELARRTTVRLVDVDRCLSGQRALFGDPVHFTSEGARRVAELLARDITVASDSRTPNAEPECGRMVDARR